jgi:hypothetical protein
VHRNYYYPTSTSPQIRIPTLTSLRDGSRSLQYTCDLCHVNSYPVQDQSHSYGATTQELYNLHDDSRSHSTLLATDCPRDYPAHAYTIHTAHTIKQPNSTPNTKPTNQQNVPPHPQTVPNLQPTLLPHPSLQDDPISVHKLRQQRRYTKHHTALL